MIMEKKNYLKPNIKVRNIQGGTILAGSDTLSIGVGGEDNDPNDWAASKSNPATPSTKSVWDTDEE